ncbi:L,D-transpeptidase family protein [Streptomyces sp. RB6PN25]|uniref:L,D-transpeptidase family protein n=1 Tax=Streptomyces humicola TaxID=2953240 RepID=A0ABT1PPG6_9ACTN|nr:L,D-transpeptidase family protein [Streptomyces humicola]MCQ4079559.1 L,D-transpeptidase family protein [Streptomyces humicola]
MKVRTARGAALSGTALLLALSAVGCTQAFGKAPVEVSKDTSTNATTAATTAASAPPSASPSDPSSNYPPGIGASTARHIPSVTRQILLVTGAGPSSSDSTAVLYQRTDDGDWQAQGSWTAHNALHGWTADHHEGDLRSPEGVFTLTDAGGLLPDPGSRLPYHQSYRFTDPGTGFEGEPLDGVFDYVIAINYNRVPGTSPLDPRKPEGDSHGGGIWLHLDHGGPSHGCVTLPRVAMLTLLRTLDPAQHPVIVMGDKDALES